MATFTRTLFSEVQVRKAQVAPSHCFFMIKLHVHVYCQFIFFSMSQQRVTSHYDDKQQKPKAAFYTSPIVVLKKLNNWLGARRPLGLIGYAIRGYDIPLLVTKNRKYGASLGS